MFVGRLGTAALLVGGQDGPRGFAARQDWPSALRASVALAADRDTPASRNCLNSLIQPRHQDAAPHCHFRRLANAIEFPILYVRIEGGGKNGSFQQIWQ